MFLLINVYLGCLIFFPKLLCVSCLLLSSFSVCVFIIFFIARLSFPHLVPAFSHFSWLVPPSHSFSSLATVGFGQLLRSPIGQQPGKKKQIPAPISLTKGPNSHSPGQAVSHCSELTGGVGGDSVGEVGVPLISRASTFYSLRQFWLPLFGCQCKSGGSGAIVSSRERTEQIGCTEQKERSQAVALLPCR